MRTTAPQGAAAMGKFSVEFQVVNNGDLEMVHRGLMPPDKVRRQTIAGVVDPGAAMLVLPQSVVKRLGDDSATMIEPAAPLAAPMLTGLV